MRRGQPTQRAPAASTLATVMGSKAVEAYIDTNGFFNSFVHVTWRYAPEAYGAFETFDPTWLCWKGWVVCSKLVGDATTLLGRYIKVQWITGDRLDEIMVRDTDGFCIAEFPPADTPIDVQSIVFKRQDPNGPTEGPADDFPDDQSSPPPAAPGIAGRLNSLRGSATDFTVLRRELKLTRDNLNALEMTVDSIASQQARLTRTVTQLMLTAPIAGDASDAQSAVSTSTAIGPSMLARRATLSTTLDATRAHRTPINAAAADDDEGDGPVLIPDSPSTVPKRAPAKSSVKSDAFGRPPLLTAALGCKGTPDCDFNCVTFTGRGKKNANLEFEKEFSRDMATKSSTATVTKETAAWIAAHELCVPAPFSKTDADGKPMCGHTKNDQVCPSSGMWMRRTSAAGSWVCNNSRCGRSVTIKTKPMCNIWGEVYYVVFVVGGKDRLNQSPKIRNFSAESATALVRRLCRVALVVNAERVTQSPSWTNMQWDETFHSQRKFQRGRRVRIGGILTFVGGVTMATDSDGNSVIAEGIIASVPNKSKVQQLALLMAMCAPGAEVSTDSATMYRDLKTAALKHRTVNHSKEFMAADGTHTNAIEGFWSVIKRRLKLWWGSQSSDPVEVAYRYQLCAYFANASFAGMSPRAAALSLYRLLVTYEQTPERFDAKVQAAEPVFCLPRDTPADDVSAHVDAGAAAETALVNELVAHAAADEDFAAAIKACEDPPTATDAEQLPLNQESNRDSGSELLSPANKAHRSETSGSVARALDFD